MKESVKIFIYKQGFVISICYLIVMWNLVKDVQNDVTVKRGENDLKSDRQDPKLLIPADKTSNLYRLTIDEYTKLLTKTISKRYKKTNKSLINRINTQGKNNSRS